MDKKYLKGPKLLLDSIWKQNGGIKEAATKCGIDSYHFSNWSGRGHVPLSRVRKVVKGLRLTKTQEWGLNYGELSLLSDGAPTWKEVVQSFGFSKNLTDTILSYVWPEAK